MKCLMSCVVMLGLVGCATLSGQFPHVAALGVGTPGDKVLAETIHVLGNPKGGGKTPVVGKEGDEIEVRTFSYSETHDLGLYFYGGLFVQAVFIKRDENVFPQVRSDYKDIANRSQGPDAYLLAMKKGKPSMEVMTKKR